MNVDGLNLLNSLYLNTKTNNLTNSTLSPNASNTNASIFDFNQGEQASAVELLLGLIVSKNLSGSAQNSVQNVNGQGRSDFFHNL